MDIEKLAAAAFFRRSFVDLVLWLAGRRKDNESWTLLGNRELILNVNCCVVAGRLSLLLASWREICFDVDSFARSLARWKIEFLSLSLRCASLALS